MSIWSRLFGRQEKDPETRRKETLRWCENAMAGVDAEIQVPSSGHPSCPLCKQKQDMSAEQMRVMMSKMTPGTIAMICCDACGARIRVRA